MKLLAWMHQKLCRSSNEQCKNFEGKTGLTLHARPVNKKDPKLMNKLEEMEMENILKDDLFHGFLTIGTLGSDPPTPTFPTPFQDISAEMELVNSELANFFSAEAQEEISDELSSPRSSISLGNMQQNGSDSDDFPLQRFLFGTGLVETASKNDEDNNSPDKARKQSCVVRFTKKVLKKLLYSTNNATKSGVIKQKLPKQAPKIKSFPEKVYPDREFIVGKPWNNEIEEEVALASTQSHIPCAGVNERLPDSETIYNPECPAENRERWITTEDDYLVLELQNGISHKSVP